MQRAIELAIRNVESGTGGPFGAVVVRDNQIVAEGVNLVTASNDPTAHAEIVAIREASKALSTFNLAGCDVYTSCEPCPMCLAAIYWARLSRVFYAARSADAAEAGFDDTRFYGELTAPYDRRSVPMINVMRDESLAAFEAWRKSPVRVDY